MIKMWFVVDSLRARVSMWFAYHVPMAMLRRGYGAHTRELIRIDTGNVVQGHGWLYAYVYCIRLLWALRGTIHSV
jgi:hypothetical protein